MLYKPVDMHRKKSNVLVVHCADPRFQAAYKAVTDNLATYYDLLVFPGASKAIADSKTVLANIKLLHDLHRFETIHIFDHIDCGAFGKVQDELKEHSRYLNSAKELLNSALPNVSVVPHLLGAKQEVRLGS